MKKYVVHLIKSEDGRAEGLDGDAGLKIPRGERQGWTGDIVQVREPPRRCVTEGTRTRSMGQATKNLLEGNRKGGVLSSP